MPPTEPRVIAGVFLARHGQTDYNAARRFQGQLPVALNELGRAQAEQLALVAVAHDFAVLWCSPLARARQTADIVSAHIGLEPIEDARLAETDAGDWTDRPFDEVRADHPDAFAAFARVDPGFAFPGGESFSGQTTRVMAALDEIAAGPTPALVVCHGMVIRLALTALGRPDPAGMMGIANGELVPLDPTG